MANTTDTTLRSGRRVATVYKGAAPGVSTNILSANINPSKNVTLYRISVALTTASVFDVYVTDGTNEYTWSLNEGYPLTAGCSYTFIEVVSHDTDGSGEGTTLNYNFQVQTDSVIEKLFVDEIVGAFV